MKRGGISLSGKNIQIKHYAVPCAGQYQHPLEPKPGCAPLWQKPDDPDSVVHMEMVLENWIMCGVYVPDDGRKHTCECGWIVYEVVWSAVHAFGLSYTNQIVG